MADRNAGGRVSIKLDNTWYHPVAEVEVEPSGIEPEVVTNQDGTINRTVTPKPFRVNLTFRDFKGLNINRLVEAESFDATVEEKDMGRNVLLTQAFVVGTPTRNTANGEISGLSIASDQYKEVAKRLA